MSSCKKLIDGQFCKLNDMPCRYSEGTEETCPDYADSFEFGADDAADAAFEAQRNRERGIL